MTVLLVAVGGALGALTRYALGTLVSSEALPWLTVAINATGSFLLGALIATRHWFPHELRTGLAVGLLGGYTTFSTFSADVFLDLEAGRAAEALLNVTGSLVFGIAGAALGYYAGRALAS